MLRAERPAGGDEQHGQSAFGRGTRSARHGTAKTGSRLPAAAVAAGRPGCAAPAAGSPAAPSGLRHPASRAGRPSYNLQSASQTAPLVGEPLAKRQSFTECQSLPSIGEVALRSNDGEVRIPMTDGTPRPVGRRMPPSIWPGGHRGDDAVRRRAFRGRAASSQPRTCARRRQERRFTAGRVARRSALRLKEM